MPIQKNKLFRELFNKFLESNKEVIAIIISDAEGLIIAGEKRKDIDIELVSVLTTIVNPILSRMRNEFDFQQFGNTSFDTEDHRLLFISVDEERVLSIILESIASIEKMAPYGLFLAEKTAQILTAEEEDLIQTSIPNFEYEAGNVERLKNQLYQMQLGLGGEYRFKFVILGDFKVGKSSIIRRFVEKRYTTDYRATIGLNVLSHEFSFFGNQIGVTLYDIGAQKFFRRFRKVYYAGAQAAFIVFDLTSRESFEHIKNWYEELKLFTPSEDIPIVIVGNKTDLAEERSVFYQEGARLANELSKSEKIKISYIETSALTGSNVEDAFNLISYHYVMKSKEIEEERRGDILLDLINSILKKKIVVTLSLINENVQWSPGLQIITNIKKLGKKSLIRDYDDEEVYQYTNGLILKQHEYSAIDDISSSDGIFCIFDARSEVNAYPNWKEIIIKLIENSKEHSVILIGIRASESTNWSEIIEQLNVDAYLEKKVVDLLFFRIGADFRLDIFDQLRVMISAIDNRY
ncbi:MAG: GTP-binding protein [Candidatus Thorarchaeota archaeon]